MRTLSLWLLVAGSLAAALWIDAESRAWSKEAACLRVGGNFRDGRCLR